MKLPSPKQARGKSMERHYMSIYRNTRRCSCGFQNKDGYLMLLHKIATMRRKWKSRPVEV